MIIVLFSEYARTQRILVENMSNPMITTFLSYYCHLILLSFFYTTLIKVVKFHLVIAHSVQ